MKKILFIAFLALASCQKDEAIVVSNDAKVILGSYGLAYSGSNPELYMDLTMTGSTNVSKAYLVTANIIYPIKVQDTNQRLYCPAYGNTNTLTGTWKFTFKDGSNKISDPFNIQY